MPSTKPLTFVDSIVRFKKGSTAHVKVATRQDGKLIFANKNGQKYAPTSNGNGIAGGHFADAANYYKPLRTSLKELLMSILPKKAPKTQKTLVPYNYLVE